MATNHREPIDFCEFTVTLIGLPISHIWRGYGSAIFLEIGALGPGRIRRNGSLGNPVGEWTLAIYSSWRIEGKRLIWCGTEVDEDRWDRALERLKDKSVLSIGLVGRLPEIYLMASNGLRVLSLTTSNGDPEWHLCKRSVNEWLSVKSGRLAIESGSGLRLA